MFGAWDSEFTSLSFPGNTDAAGADFEDHCLRVRPHCASPLRELGATPPLLSTYPHRVRGIEEGPVEAPSVVSTLMDSLPGKTGLHSSASRVGSSDPPLLPGLGELALESSPFGSTSTLHRPPAYELRDLVQINELSQLQVFSSVEWG